jgi:hypothetical protein
LKEANIQKVPITTCLGFSISLQILEKPKRMELTLFLLLASTNETMVGKRKEIKSKVFNLSF